MSGHDLPTTVLVRYFAGARAAAGTGEEKIDLTGRAVADARAGDAPTVADLAAVLAERHGPALARVLTAASFLVDEVAGSRDRPLHDGAVVDVLPPFAGG